MPAGRFFKSDPQRDRELVAQQEAAERQRYAAVVAEEQARIRAKQKQAKEAEIRSTIQAVLEDFQRAYGIPGSVQDNAIGSWGYTSDGFYDGHNVVSVVVKEGRNPSLFVYVDKSIVRPNWSRDLLAVLQEKIGISKAKVIS